MHTFISRVSQTSGTFSTAVSVLAVVLGLIGYIQLHLGGVASQPVTLDNVDLRMSLRNTRRAGSVNGVPKENIRVSFDLDADLSALFNWNTKQVFVYLTAEYGGARPDISNVVTFWDKVITSKEQAHLQLTGERGKYNVWDTQESFGGRNASLTLRWDVQPHVGVLSHGSGSVEAGTVSVEFPTTESTSKEQPAARAGTKKRAKRAQGAQA